jgi:uncharacterized protein YrzB (UPF0473 family)
MEEKTFTLMNAEGVETKYDVLFTFDSEDTEKSYIAYTDNTYDEEGNIQVYASTYDPNSEEMILGEIKTDKEWKVIETILDTIQQELREKQESSEQ